MQSVTEIAVFMFLSPNLGNSGVFIIITPLENLYDYLLNMKNEIVLDEDVRLKALRSLENMHKLGSEKNE